MSVEGFEVPVHRALTEPILLGGERAVEDRHACLLYTSPSPRDS